MVEPRQGHLGLNSDARTIIWQGPWFESPTMSPNNWKL